MKKILEKLGIKEVNSGACSGPEDWYEDPQSEEIVSYNPTNGEATAKVLQATEKTYEQVLTQATEVFKKWRMIPAPKHGLIIRDLGDTLRELKEPLELRLAVKRKQEIVFCLLFSIISPSFTALFITEFSLP